MTHRVPAASPDGLYRSGAAPLPEPACTRLQRIDRLASHGRLLLLQGPNGPFFRRLALRLRDLGATVTKVNLNAGDDLFHPRADAVCFEKRADEWPGFLEGLLCARRIAAVVLFGQDRPLHRVAAQLAQRLGIAVVVFEEGYVRPCWITMELDGVNGRSALMRPLEPAPAVHVQPAQPQQFRFAFAAMAAFSVAYLLWGCIFRCRYPHYVHHKPLTLREAIPWLRCYRRKAGYVLVQRSLLRRLCGPSAPPFFLVSLQMAVDSQIIHHSPWRSNEDFIRAVLASFAAHAGSEELLVFKHHPLEIGHAHYGAVIAREAELLGVARRVHYVHGGHLPSLLQRARGVVLVNSTVGLQAMHHGTPVCATGDAIYAKPGLTHQEPLDAFWNRPQNPDPAAFRSFLDRVLDTSQVNSSFYAPGAWWR